MSTHDDEPYGIGNPAIALLSIFLIAAVAFYCTQKLLRAVTLALGTLGPRLLRRSSWIKPKAEPVSEWIAIALSWCMVIPTFMLITLPLGRHNTVNLAGHAVTSVWWCYPLYACGLLVVAGFQAIAEASKARDTTSSQPTMQRRSSRRTSPAGAVAYHPYPARAQSTASDLPDWL
jgi:choline-glycine betaine transporter